MHMHDSKQSSDKKKKLLIIIIIIIVVVVIVIAVLSLQICKLCHGLLHQLMCVFGLLDGSALLLHCWKRTCLLHNRLSGSKLLGQVHRLNPHLTSAQQQVCWHQTFVHLHAASALPIGEILITETTTSLPCIAFVASIITFPFRI